MIGLCILYVYNNSYNIYSCIYLSKLRAINIHKVRIKFIKIPSKKFEDFLPRGLR